MDITIHRNKNSMGRVIQKNQKVYNRSVVHACRCIPLIMTMVFRDALGEYTAAAFMPVVAAAMYLIYTDEETTKRPDIKNATLLALAMSGPMYYWEEIFPVLIKTANR